MVKTFVAVAGDHGAINLPAEARESLGLQAGDRIAVTIVADHVELRRVDLGPSLRSTQGIVPSILDRAEGDFDELIEEAMEEHVQEFETRWRSERP